MNRHHPSTCACGLPFVTRNGIRRCPHCETRDCHDVLAGKHPSMHCVDCARLDATWNTRWPPPASRPRHQRH